MTNKEKKFRKLIRESIRKILKEDKDENIDLKNGEFVIEKLVEFENVENKLREKFAKIYFISSKSGSIKINPWVAKVINNSLSVFDYSHIGNYTKEIRDYHSDDLLIEIESNRDGSIIFRTKSNEGDNEPGSIRIEKDEVQYFIKTVSNFLSIPERITFDFDPRDYYDDSEDDNDDDDDDFFGDDPFDSMNFN